MTYRKERLFGWLKIILAIAVIGVFALPLTEGLRVLNIQSEAVPANTPSVTAERMRVLIQQADTELAAAPGESPESYFARVIDAQRIENIHRKFLQEHPDLRADPNVGIGQVGEDMFRITQIQQAYNARFGQSLMASIAARPDIRAQTDDSILEDAPPIPNQFEALFMAAIFESMLFAALFFAVAVKKQGMMIWVEIDRIAFAAITWPYSFFKYPVNIGIREQIARLRQRLAYVFAGLLSVAPAGAFAKAVGETPGENCDSGANTLVLNTDAIPKLTLSTGISSLKIGGNGVVLHDGPTWTWDANASFKNGLFLDQAGTRSLGRSDNSDEDDWSLGWSGNVGNMDLGLTLEVAYWDIRPLASTKGGDFLAPIVEIEKPVVAGITLFAHAEFDGLTDHPENEGYVLQVGERRSWDIGDGLSLSESLSLVETEGPFGHEAGTLGRYDASLSKQITDQLSATVWMKGFIPFSRFGDRSPDVAVGAGLSFAVN